jgi:hypothetical protein
MKKIIDKHYSQTKQGIIEVNKNWKHKCIERCDSIKRINKMMFLCEDLKQIMKNSPPQKTNNEK